MRSQILQIDLGVPNVPSEIDEERVSGFLAKLSSEDWLELVEDTFKVLGLRPGRVSKDEVLSDLNDLLRSLCAETLVALDAKERQSRGSMAGDPQQLSGTILAASLTNTSLREMTIAARDLEVHLQGLFHLSSLPFDKEERKSYTNYVLPDLKTYRTDPRVSAFVSVKQSLRNVADVVAELSAENGPNVYLLTADQHIAEEQVSMILDAGIQLVVWDSLKAVHFREQPGVLGYSRWGSDHLGPLSELWPAKTPE